MHKGQSCHIDKDRIRTPGVNYGYGDSSPYLIHRGERHLVIKKKGTQDWSQRGQTSHYPAQWWLVQVEWLAKKDHFKVVEVVDTKEPGTKWRAARQELIDKVTELETTVVESKVTAAEMKMLGRVFEAEIEGRRFQSKSKLLPGMVEKGLIVALEADEPVFGGLTMHVEWHDLTHLGRMLFCMSCEDAPDEP